MLYKSMIAGVACVLAMATAAMAEVKVELSEMHICCGACVKALDGIAAKIEGAKFDINKDEGKVAVTAPDRKTARKAVNQLARAGFHAKSSDEKLVMKAQEEVPSGKVAKLTVKGAHNCCGACTTAIKACCEEVGGITANDITAKATSFTVKGDVDAAALVKALNAAGFHVTVAE